MRLIDADAYAFPGDLVNEPTIEAIPIPCPIGSDCWYVDPDTLEVMCEKGGIKGFVIREDEILALDSAGELEIHSELCCLTREEAEELRDKIKNAARHVVHGRWIKGVIEREPKIKNGRVYNNNTLTFRCSECEATFTEYAYGYTYCPNCDAKMDLK